MSDSNAALLELLYRRGINHIVHFHCDHFEPFRKDKSGQQIGLEHIKAWNENRLRYPQGNCVTLFLSSQRYCYVLAPPPADTERKKRLYPIHDIYFDNTSFADEEERVLDFLATQPDLDFQMHLHHEWWTSSSCTKWEADPVNDLLRIEAVLKLHLAHYSAHLPFNASEWSFVHGCWSLNASDRSICNITGELKLLQSMGCIADFSFPAGRPWCDPKSIKVPYTVTPFDAERCYDLPEAHPIAIAQGACGFTYSGPRMMIWSANVPSSHVSFDAIAAAQVTQNPYELVTAWLGGCPVIDGTLYLKTHCHSLQWDTWSSPSGQMSLIGSPEATHAFALLYTCCNSAHVDIEHITVDKLVKRLKAIDAGDVQ